MKKFLLPIFLIVILSACNNAGKAQENALLDSVKAVHEKVMADDDKGMTLRTQLKQLLLKKPELKDSVNYILKKMDDNDNVMMDWMNKFNPDFTGKSHEQVINYLGEQKKQVMGIDSLLKKQLKDVSGFYTRNKF